MSDGQGRKQQQHPMTEAVTNLVHALGHCTDEEIEVVMEVIWLELSEAQQGAFLARHRDDGV